MNLKPATRVDVFSAHARVTEAVNAGDEPTQADLKLLTKHYLAVLEGRAPGKSVEVRVPPFAAVQCIEGVRHTRGTPPAVIETDAKTWIALATGALAWSEVAEGGPQAALVQASGERTDLSEYLPLNR